VSSTAAWLREVASERAALGDAISRSPAVLAQGQAVLRDVSFALGVLDPTLSDLRPVAPRLATFLRVLVPAAKNAGPTIAGVQALVPGARRALVALPQAVAEAVPAVNSLTKALKPLTPMLAGIRPYMPDVVAGFFNGVGGAVGGNYDANGHYIKTMATVQAGGSSLTGLLNVLGALLGGVTGTVPQLHGARTHLIAPCPGGGTPPAFDHSNPWTSPDLPAATGKICNPADDQQ
jgi:hypothetical protein